MNFLKQFALFLFCVALVTMGLSLILPDYQEAKRSIRINAPAELIYEKLKSLEEFNRFSTWSKEDSGTQFTTTGRDGTVGASIAWKGHPMISGEGNISITELVPGRKVGHRIDFIKPKKGKANSVFDLAPAAGSTDVTWTFRLATPRPRNIFNLFYKMEKERGQEFEDGLKMLKKRIENDSL